MRVKVCGMTKAEQVHQLDEIGVEFAGFIFYPQSPRYVYRHLTSEQIKNIRGRINKVGVFVNAEADEVLKAVDDCGLYVVQLHGNETPKLCEKIADYITVIKAFRINENENIEWKIREYYDVVDMFMFDTAATVLSGNKKEEMFGGTGEIFNWQLLKGLNIRKPFFLSGGIGADDAEQLKEFSSDTVSKDLFAVDINSRFEILPGVKNVPRVKNFIEELNR